MTERYCSWHRPAPILLERVDDGRPEVLRTDGLCLDYLLRELDADKQAINSMHEVAKVAQKIPGEPAAPGPLDNGTKRDTSGRSEREKRG